MGKDEEKKALPKEEPKSAKETAVEGGKKALDAATEVGNKAVSEAKKFSEKDFGKFKGKHILMGVCAVVVLLLLVVIVKGLFGSKDVEYPVIYNNSDSDLYLMTTKVKSQDKAVKLSSGDSASDVTYANNTNRYVLFIKNESLYLYDAKKKDETTKLVSDVSSTYGFTEDDKYVVAMDEDGTLYSYNFGKDKEKLDSDVARVYDASNTKILYAKDDDLYIRSLNAKKDDRVKVTDEFSYPSLSEDGKNIVYINDDGDLYLYTISKKDGKKVASDVLSYICDTKSCTNMYYMVQDGSDTIIYYYNGKEGKKIVEEATIQAVDVDKQLLVYTTEDDDESTLYFKKGSAEAAKIEDDLDGIRTVRIFNGKEIYYVTSDGEVKYAKISGNKVTGVKSLAEDAGSLYEYKNGYVFVADVPKDKSLGDLYFASNGKAKKVDSDVNTYLIKVSNDGSKVYYMKDYKNSGDLYVSSGGKGKKIDSDVYTFQYIKDNLIYYIKDYSTSKSKGDLYRYTGKSVKLAEDVTRIAYTPNSFTKNK